MACREAKLVKRRICCGGRRFESGFDTNQYCVAAATVTNLSYTDDIYSFRKVYYFSFR